MPSSYGHELVCLLNPKIFVEAHKWFNYCLPFEMTMGALALVGFVYVSDWSAETQQWTLRQVAQL